MSQENVELAQKLLAPFNAGDYDKYLDYFASDAEVIPDASRFPEAAPFRGRDAHRAFLEEIGAAWETGAQAAIREVLDAEGFVVMRCDWGGTGKASGMEVYSNLTCVFTVEDGKIVRAEYFFDHEQALEAVGLRK
ncbi:MAG TPA: nuclear transport factor 2 family protein [Solirubrobacteraceae bacterium]|nr:nuclear transport factor 2 family protein [Solirubrobacteraceae bacterium]